jgi:hypothetical protein
MLQNKTNTMKASRRTDIWRNRSVGSGAMRLRRTAANISNSVFPAPVPTMVTSNRDPSSTGKHHCTLPARGTLVGRSGGGCRRCSRAGQRRVAFGDTNQRTNGSGLGQKRSYMPRQWVRRIRHIPWSKDNTVSRDTGDN